MKTASVWMTAPEAAAVLDIGPDVVRRLIRIGVLEGRVRPNGDYRVRAASVYHYRAMRQQGGTR